ncbi:MAG: hypothetical protein Q7U04_06765 [Bacteriovorax sp.]|nr:hypothetical protein [Bacteriovorax sp.]
MDVPFDLSFKYIVTTLRKKLFDFFRETFNESHAITSLLDSGNAIPIGENFIPSFKSFSFNIKEKEINIAISCDLKISQERGLFAKQNGICLKASSVRLEGENELVADKNAPINISAMSSVTIRRSSLETKGDLSITTSSFLPLEGEILISRESILKARNIHINSKSNLIINSESKLKADSVILNGGNCEINDKNDRDNDDEREHDKECKKFKPSFLYTGTCTSNPLPTNLEITSAVNASNSQSVNFNISGAPSASAISWMFDHSFLSIEQYKKSDLTPQFIEHALYCWQFFLVINLILKINIHEIRSLKFKNSRF